MYDAIKSHHDRPVNVLDYNEYRKLEEKRDRILLKKTLYEQKKTGDESQVALLNDELERQKREKEDLNSRADALKRQLAKVQKDIVGIDKARQKEVQRVEQEKRRDIIKRSGQPLPLASGTASKTGGSNSRYLSKNTSRSPGKRVQSPGSSNLPNLSNVKSSGYGGHTRQRTPSRERVTRRSPSRDRHQKSSQGTRIAHVDHASNRTGRTGITAVTGRTAQPTMAHNLGAHDNSIAPTEDGRTAAYNADRSFGNLDATNHQSGITSITGLPNDPFGNIVEQADPVVVNAEADDQPMFTEIPMETRESNVEVGGRREISSSQADRIINQMIDEEQKTRIN
jgi:hypothetical protein